MQGPICTILCLVPPAGALVDSSRSVWEANFCPPKGDLDAWLQTQEDELRQTPEWNISSARVADFVGRNRGQRIALVTSGGTAAPLELNTVRFIDNFRCVLPQCCCVFHPGRGGGIILLVGPVEGSACACYRAGVCADSNFFINRRKHQSTLFRYTKEP
ncbi:unnamed protein product [Schistocephalus solidus]|uniref:AMP-binding domain-containing protein n=1 Tax=Schistocephalus solidus TaxID=70667 RepID=A0A183T5N5_SCHSO|nr:unnamed protein product [Schistocephalus solidus]